MSICELLLGGCCGAAVSKGKRVEMRDAVRPHGALEKSRPSLPSPGLSSIPARPFRGQLRRLEQGEIYRTRLMSRKRARVAVAEAQIPCCSASFPACGHLFCACTASSRHLCVDCSQSLQSKRRFFVEDINLAAVAPPPDRLLSCAVPHLTCR